MSGSPSGIGNPELGTWIKYTEIREEEKQETNKKNTNVNNNKLTYMGQPPPARRKTVRQWAQVLTPESRSAGSSNLGKKKMALTPQSFYLMLCIRKALVLHLCRASWQKHPGIMKQAPKQSLLQAKWSCSIMRCPLLLKPEQSSKRARLMHRLLSFHDDSLKTTFSLRVYLVFMLKSI